MSSKQKKIVGTTVAVILVLALGIAGTFAASGSDSSDGGIEGTVDTKIVLHDDFSDTWTGADNDDRDRDVYVENAGSTKLYLRLRLDEFMEYGGKIIVGGGSKTDTTKWKPHVPSSGSNMTDCAEESHDYFTLAMGNTAGFEYTKGWKNKYQGTEPVPANKGNAPATKVIALDEWLNKTPAERADFGPCWLVDANVGSDSTPKGTGYAYWYKQLPGKDSTDCATGKLLDTVHNTGLIDESYFYGINVKAEAVTETDLNTWIWGGKPTDSTVDTPKEEMDAASGRARRLLKILSPKYTEITSDMNQTIAKDLDGDNDGFLTKSEYNDYLDQLPAVTPTP